MNDKERVRKLVDVLKELSDDVHLLDLGSIGILEATVRSLGSMVLSGDDRFNYVYFYGGHIYLMKILQSASSGEHAILRAEIARTVSFLAHDNQENAVGLQFAGACYMPSNDHLSPRVFLFCSVHVACSRGCGAHDMHDGRQQCPRQADGNNCHRPPSRQPTLG